MGLTQTVIFRFIEFYYGYMGDGVTQFEEFDLRVTLDAKVSAENTNLCPIFPYRIRCAALPLPFFSEV
jgi:hypothetical protein